MPRGRPKSQSAPVSTDVSIENKVGENELWKLIQEQQKQIEELKKIVLNKENRQDQTENFEIENDFEDDFNTIKINQEDYIKVVSLCPYQLNLSTLPGGRGKLFAFPSFGSTKRILYSDLVQILESFSHFLNDGFFFVADKRVIRRHGFNELYSHILSKETIEKILDGTSTSDIVSLMKSTSKVQQEIIAQLFVDRMLAGQEVDLNFLDKLKRASGIDIQQKYENTKEYVDSLNIKEEE